MATPIIANAVTTVLSLALSWKGQRNQIVDIYNNYFKENKIPYPRGHRVVYEDQLCATFVSALFIYLKWTDLVLPECGARQLYNNMKALDRAKTTKTRVPDPGDLIFFGTASQGVTHVGIVRDVQNGKQIYYYDLQSTVGVHTVPVGYSWIYGYGIPDYAAAPVVSTVPAPAPATAIKAGDLVTIREGAKWYNGATIPASVMADQWHVVQNKNGRAVLGQNAAKTRYIQSPIRDTDLVPVNGPVEENTYRELTVKISLKAYERLKKLAMDDGLTLSEAMEELIGA